MAEDRPAYFAPRRQAKSRIRVVECRLNASPFKQITCKVFAASLAHAVRFEKRAADAGLCMFAETVPRVGFRFDGSAQKIFQKGFNCVLHAYLTIRK